MRLNISGVMDRVGSLTVVDDQPAQTDTLPLPDAALITSLMITLKDQPSVSTSIAGNMIAVGQLSGEPHHRRICRQ